MDDLAQRITSNALTFRMAMPRASALQVLDTAMTPHRGAQPDFSTDTPLGDAADPRSPFGALVFEVFADRPLGDLAPAQVDEAGQMTELSIARAERALLAFGMRYQLWEGDDVIERARWHSQCLTLLHEHWKRTGGMSGDAVDLYGEIEGAVLLPAAERLAPAKLVALLVDSQDTPSGAVDEIEAMPLDVPDASCEPEVRALLRQLNA